MWLSEKSKASLGEVRDLPDMKPIIEKVIDDPQIHYDNGVMRAVQDCGIHVDKERLLKAMTDARAFYDEGYAAGQTAQQKWIPVTERLPENEGSFLVYTARGSVCTNHFYPQKTFHDGYTRKAGWSGRKCITHWMPLPLPPKEDA